MKELPFGLYNIAFIISEKLAKFARFTMSIVYATISMYSHFLVLDVYKKLRLGK